jgi:hypothetical protein
VAFTLKFRWRNYSVGVRVDPACSDHFQGERQVKHDTLNQRAIDRAIARADMLARIARIRRVAETRRLVAASKLPVLLKRQAE